MNLSGCTVAVTGAASGIGAALAVAAAMRGARAVAIIDIDPVGAEETAQRVREQGALSAVFECDIAEPAQLEEVTAQLCETFGVPDLVCANAGVNTPPARLLDGDVEDLRWALSVNVVGTAGVRCQCDDSRVGGDGSVAQRLASSQRIRRSSARQ